MATKTKTSSKVTTNSNTGAKLKKGESFTDSKTGKSYTEGQNFNSSSYVKAVNNPVVSSTMVRADNSALNKDIKNLKNAYDDDNAQIQAEMAALAERRVNEVAGIKTEFDIAKVAQELGQESSYADRSTKLITSGGGFLGATQSQEGVLQNLKGTFEQEKTALMAKREAAVLAANQAYEDKDFALARELSKNAKDLQNEIYKRQTDFADQQLKIASEKRQQTEFDMGVSEKKAQTYSYMSDADFADIDPQEIAQSDAFFYPGFTAAKRLIDKKALEVKTNKEAVALDIDILQARNSVDLGKKFMLGGQTYTGLKVKDTSGGGTETERNNKNIYDLRTRLFVPGTTITGGKFDGAPIIETATGKFTKEGFKEALRISNLSRDTFLKEFQGLINMSAEVIKNYELSDTDIKKLQGTLPYRD